MPVIPVPRCTYRSDAPGALCLRCATHRAAAPDVCPGAPCRCDGDGWGGRPCPRHVTPQELRRAVGATLEEDDRAELERGER